MPADMISCITSLRDAEIKIVYDNNSTKKSKCPKFSGKGGIEELILIVEMFEDICSDLQVPGDDKFNHFKSVLEHGPAKWSKLDPANNYKTKTGSIVASRTTMQRTQQQRIHDMYSSNISKASMLPNAKMYRSNNTWSEWKHCVYPQTSFMGRDRYCSMRTRRQSYSTVSQIRGQRQSIEEPSISPTWNKKIPSPS